MARTISRGTRMNERIYFRATPEDITNLKLAAQRQGVDVSAFIRNILIKERVFSPLGTGETF